MKLRGAAIAVVAAFMLAGCGSSADESTVRACNLLAKAEDDVADTTNLYAQTRSISNAQAIRDATKNYPVLISKAADEALSGPADISASFQDAAKNAKLYRQAIEAGDGNSAGVFSWAISDTVKKCEEAGVEMPISDINSG